MATYPVSHQIGRGSFGDVFLCEDTTTGHPIVDKNIRVENLTADELERVENEISVIMRLKHPHIVMLNGYVKVEGIMHVYMEYMPGGDLARLITEYRLMKKPFGQTVVIKYLSQLLSAVGHIHRKKFIHRDLKPANILLSKDKKRLKVTDFGVSAACASFASKHQSTIGTVAYMAPEVAEGKPYERKCDVWSLGVIAYELVEMKLPYHTSHLGAMLTRISKGKIEPMKSKGGAALRELIMSMLNRASDHRPECSALLQNALFEVLPDISTLRIKEPSLGEVWQAACDGELPRLQQLLEDSSNDRVLIDGLHETDTWMKNTTPTMAAADRGHNQVVTWIINQNKARMDTPGIIKGGGREVGGVTALFLASCSGHPSVVETLIDHGRANVGAVNEEGMTGLMWAAAGGNCDVIRTLIKRGNSVVQRKTDGRTALHCAAEEGKVEAIELLISEGAEVDAKDNQQFAPLHLAAYFGHPPAVVVLLERGGNIEARNLQQCTPLSMAALNGHVDVLRVLVDKGADIGVRGFKKMTPLHTAAERGNASAISFLLAAGCDITATDEDGRTPKAVAEYFSQPEAARLLGR